MEEMDLAIREATSPAVQVWMNWILIIFSLSLVFVWKHKSARVVVLCFILTIPIALLVFSLSKSVHLIGIAHILLWGPLVFYLVKNDLKHPSFQIRSPYAVWVILLLGTIAVSLVFDVRDVSLVLLGMK